MNRFVAELRASSCALHFVKKCLHRSDVRTAAPALGLDLQRRELSSHIVGKNEATDTLHTEQRNDVQRRQLERMTARLTVAARAMPQVQAFCLEETPREERGRGARGLGGRP